MVDSPGVQTAFSFGAVALRSIGLISRSAAAWDSGDGGMLATGWERDVLEIIGTPPSRIHPLNQCSNAFVAEIAAGRLREAGHGRSLHAVCAHMAQNIGACKSQIERVVQRARRSESLGGAMTAGAVLSVELAENRDLRGGSPAI